MRWIALVLALAATNAYGTSFVCIPEVTTSAMNNGSDFEVGKLENGKMFSLTNVNGKWINKLQPDGHVFFERCLSEFYCDAGDEKLGAAFMREPSVGPKSKFTAVWMSRTGDTLIASVSMGYCTKIE